MVLRSSQVGWRETVNQMAWDIFGVMVGMISWMYTDVKTIKLYTINVYNLLHVIFF